LHKNNQIMRNFESWETQDLETEFGLVQLRQMSLLDNWLESTTTLNENETNLVEYLRNKLLDNADFWNEDELKLQFIAPLLLVVNFDMPNYKVFSQRPLSATINGIEIGGRVDFMLAKGKQKPVQPYFFIHEYKQESKKGSSDAKGQLLSELLAAYHRNDSHFPLYGCYVIGRNWFFVILDSEKYAVSNAFNASDKDIYQIIAILRQVKTNILNLS
jgi:hypothetical protein